MMQPEGMPEKHPLRLYVTSELSAAYYIAERSVNLYGI